MSDAMSKELRDGWPTEVILWKANRQIRLYNRLQLGDMGLELSQKGQSFGQW